MTKIYLNRKIKNDSFVSNKLVIRNDVSNGSLVSNKLLIRNQKVPNKIYKGLNTHKLREEFVPEIEPELLSYKEDYWKKVFPRDLNNISEDDFKKLQISNIGSYSIFLPKYSNKLAKLLRRYLPDNKATITDATSNMGGAVYGFSRYFDNINAVEIVQLHCDILKNNIDLYKINDKVKIICNDYIDVYKDLKQDMIFFDPPWGGTDYKNDELLNLSLDNIPIEDIFKELINIKAAKFLTMRVPSNYDFKKIFSIATRINVHSFYRDDGKLSFFLVVIKIF